MITRSDSERLIHLADIATTLGLADVAKDARDSAERVGAGRFYVACVGQFKRGKSTLIDALLDDPILPAGVVPVTAIPTIVRFGPERSARVRFQPAHARSTRAGIEEWTTIPVTDIEQYVAEESNPGNARGVLAVEVCTPSPLLADGMCLVDTPGLGSVFESNTLATEAFVPQIDAAIVVLGADPPITGDELALIANVSNDVRDLIFVLNKADRVSPQDLSEASAFTRRVLADCLGSDGVRIYAVSASEQLSHVGDPRDWEAMQRELRRLAHVAGKGVVQQSGRRAVQRAVDALLASVRDERAALLRYEAEGERHIAILDGVISEGHRMLQDIGALFVAEQRRVSAHFAERRRHFLGYDADVARARLRDRIIEQHGAYGPGLRRRMMRDAQEIAQDVLAPWMSTEQEEAHVAFSRTFMRFIEMTRPLVDKLTSGAGEMSALRSSIDTDSLALDARSRFVFNSVTHVAEPASPLRFGADLFLGVAHRSSLENAAISFLDWLLEMNSSRVHSDVEQRIDESRRRLEESIRHQLAGVQSRARELADRAKRVRAEGAHAVADALRRLSDTENSIASIAVAEAPIGTND